jgi:hypothetical protein
MRLLRSLCLLALVATLPACATITSGSSQSVTVITEPAGAACNLQREGATVGVVNPTPGTVQISKSVQDISVRCTRQGHSPGVVALPAQFQAMTLGNVLLGGLIGIAVDAASGAMGRYPESVTVSLPPEAFPDAARRDAVFIEQAATLRRTFQSRIDTVIGQCNPTNRVSCDARVVELEKERDAELNRLEQLRQAARVGT